MSDDRVNTTVAPASVSSRSAASATARFRSFSVNPDGPTAPYSWPPWPGSSTTWARPTGSPAVMLRTSAHGVATSHEVRPYRARWSVITGTTTPLGVMTAVASAASGRGANGWPGWPAGTGGGTVVVALGVVVVVVRSEVGASGANANPSGVAPSSPADGDAVVDDVEELQADATSTTTTATSANDGLRCGDGAMASRSAPAGPL